MNKKETRALLAEKGLRPNKKLGQNFLCRDDILERINDAAGVSESDRILEIGPGLGFLTEKMASRGALVTAVEVDAGLHRFLTGRLGGSVVLYHADFLKLDIHDSFTKSVSNLPYCCASEILFRLAADFTMPEVYVMLQKEMAERIMARPGEENYGAMSVTLGLYFNAKLFFEVGAGAFYPEPGVRSSFLGLARKEELPDAPVLRAFHAVVKSAFWGRRKTLESALARSPHLDLGREGAQEICGAAGIEGSRRGEDLGLQEFLDLARALKGRSTL